METFIKVKVKNNYLDLIPVKICLRYEDSMSPIFFKVILEKSLGAMNIRNNRKLTFKDSSLGLLAYANN